MIVVALAGWLISVVVLSASDDGELGGAIAIATVAYGLAVAIAAIGARRRALSRIEAAVSAIPVGAVLAVCVLLGWSLAARNAEFRGEPLFRDVGIALWATWAAVVAASALGLRSRWSGVAAIAATVFIGLAGVFFAGAQVD
jgi:hypothetical protein